MSPRSIARLGLAALLVAGCSGQVPLAVTTVSVVDFLSADGGCLEFTVYGDAGVLRRRRLARDGGASYVFGLARFDRATTTLAVQAKVLKTDRCLTGTGGVLQAQSPLTDVQFVDGGAGQIRLQVEAPSSALDADHDGFVARDAGGDDCDDALATANLSAPQVCGLNATVDNDCDGLRGCADSDCATAPACSQLLRFQGVPVLAAGECLPYRVERHFTDGGPSTEDVAQRLQVRATTSSGELSVLYPTQTCASGSGGAQLDLVIPARQPAVTSWMRAVRLGSVELSTVSELPTARAETSVEPGPPKALTVDFPPEVTAGDCQQGAVSLLDGFGNETVNDGGLAAIALTVDGGLLYADNCSTPTTTGAVPAGTSSLPLFFRGVRVAPVRVTASAPGLDAGVASFRVAAGPPSKLVFTQAPQGTLPRFGCHLVQVESRDTVDNPRHTDAGFAVVGDAGTLGVQAFEDPACTQPAPATLYLTDGGRSFRVRFRGSGSGLLLAAAPRLAAATAAVTLAGGVALDMPPVADLEAGGCAPLNVDRREGSATAAAWTFGDFSAQLSLPVNPSEGLTVHEQPDCSGEKLTLPLTLTFADGESRKTLYVRGNSAPYSPTVTPTFYAFETGQTAGPTGRPVTPLPLVRRGRCSLGTTSTNTTSVTCPLVPTLSALDRSFLVFQATGPQDAPPDMNVECHLVMSGAAAAVSCSRFGGDRAVEVAYQVVSFARSAADGGVTVTHRDSLTPGSTVPVANEQRSFVLFSHASPSGASNGAGEYLVPRVSNNTLSFVGSSPSPLRVSAQVVELPSSALVLHTAVASPSDPSGVLQLANLADVGDLGRTVALVSSVVETTQPRACARSVGVRLGDGTSATVRRGVDGTASQCWAGLPYAQVALQRIRFGDGATAQRPDWPTITASQPDEVSFTVPGTPADRTVAWFPGQGPSGQTQGETILAGADGGVADDATGAAHGLLEPVGPDLWRARRARFGVPTKFSPQFVTFTP